MKTTIHFTPFRAVSSYLGAVLCVLCFALAFVPAAQAQLNIKAEVTTVYTDIPDCDTGFFNFLILGSDPIFQWSGTGLTSSCFEYSCPDGQSCSVMGNQNANRVIYDNFFACPAQIPATLSVNFHACENDGVSCTCLPLVGCTAVGAICDGNANATNSIPMPTVAGVTSYTFSAISTTGCMGTYTYTIVITATGTFPPPLADNICTATAVPVDGAVHNYAWCGSYTNETNEVNPASGGFPNMISTKGTGWFYFVAPPSGAVTISTNNNTQIGTKIVVYHAADGVGCGHGISASGASVKEKFEYLSSYAWADDGGIPIISPSNAADIDMNDCNTVFAGGRNLVGGETYYVQVTTDNVGEIGNLGIMVKDLGGSGAPGYDIPCQSTGASITSTPISHAAGSTTTTDQNVSCTGGEEVDGGGSSGSPNPHAYSYASGTSSNSIQSGLWVNFTAPNSGNVFFESLYGSGILNEDNAMYAYDPRFAPGRPSDFACKDLVQIASASGGTIFGGTAKIDQRCLEPGYKYYGLTDVVGTTFFGTNMHNWIYAKPSTAPANDILCLAMQNPAFNVPVELLGGTATTAIGGTNAGACIEQLAGERPQPNGADKTVWYYFTAPLSGVVDVTVVTGSIGTANVAIFHALNGQDCYGGLKPATFTTDGTPTSALITELGSAYGAGTLTAQVCCLKPGDKYAVQIDGGNIAAEGTFTIKIKEVDVQGGFTAYTAPDATIHNATTPPPPAYVCFGGVITASGTGSVKPSAGCLDEGFILHNQATPVAPYTGMTIYQKATPSNFFFVNNGTAPYNTPLYVSSLVDNAANWGHFCPSARIRDAVPVVFLSPITAVAMPVSACGDVSVTVSGGLPAFLPASQFAYTIAPSTVTVSSGVVSNNGVIQFRATQAGTYILNITDANGCTKALAINIPSISLVTATIAPASPVKFCNGSAAMITASATATSNNIFTYSWTQPDGSNATANPLTANQVGFYTVTATNALGCKNTASVYVDSVKGAPLPRITVTKVLCSNSAATVLVSPSYSLASYISYAWSNGVTTASPTIALNGTGPYTVTATNINGCTNTASITLALNLAPAAPAIVPSRNLCSGSFATLTANPLYPHYQWTPLDTSRTYTITAAGLYTVTVTDAVGCTNTSTLAVQQFPNPSAVSVTQNSALCTNTAAFPTLNGGAILDAGAQAVPVQYTWSSTSPTNYHTRLDTVFAAGSYAVTVSTVAGGCTATATFNVAFAQSPAPIITQTSPLCNNANGGLTVAGSVLYTYVWSSGTAPFSNPYAVTTAGTYTVTATDIQTGCRGAASASVVRGIAPPVPTLTQLNPLCPAVGSSAIVVASAITGGNYVWSGGSRDTAQVITAGGVYTVTVSYAGGCSASASLTVNVAPPLSTTIIGQPNAYLCLGDTVRLSTATPFASYRWNNGSGDASIRAYQGGTYSVTITNASGCSGTASIALPLYALPTVDAGTDQTIYYGQSIVLNAASSAAINCLWTPVTALDFPNNCSPRAAPSETTTYMVVVSDTNGCRASDAVTITVVDELECLEPNEGITPNADGKNDTWVITCLAYFPDNTVQIYNRWGTLLYERKGYDNTFDGTYNGAALPDATYYYVVTVRTHAGGTRLYRGTLSVIR